MPAYRKAKSPQNKSRGCSFVVFILSLVHIVHRKKKEKKALPAEAQKPDMPVVLGKVCLAFPVIQLWAHTQNYQPIGSVFH